MAETVFLHGWGLHGGIWSSVRADLAANGPIEPTTRAPELPGYGDVPMVSPYTVERVAESVAESVAVSLGQSVLDGVQAPVNLVGWSMGGMVAMALAARYPERVAKLVLVGSSACFMNRPGWAHGLEPAVLQAFADDLAHDYQATLQRFLSLQARGGDAARTVVTQLRQAVLARAAPRPDVLAAGLNLLREVDVRHLAEEVRCPTLLLHGAHDKLCPVSAADWLHAHLPDARLIVHAQASHAPFISHPQWFVNELRNFLHEH
jgi:pimeloyl-[acyl-carrier protein] methyl ester esterase